MFTAGHTPASWAQILERSRLTKSSTGLPKIWRPLILLAPPHPPALSISLDESMDISVVVALVTSFGALANWILRALGFNLYESLTGRSADDDIESDGGESTKIRHERGM